MGGGDDAPPAEPCCRKTPFLGFRAAARTLWGEAGIKAIAERIEPEAAAATVHPVMISDEWLPERFVMAWYDAVWDGPAQRDVTKYAAFIDLMMDNGFGRVRKLLLSIATPQMLARQAPELWRYDHTTGTLACEMPNDHTLVATLRDHVYTTTLISRRSVAEIYRYAISLVRTKDTRVTHSLDDSDLVCRITWR